MTEEKVFGIDLGTTYSAIAHINDYDQAEIIENDEGSKVTPSVVYFEDAENFIVGREAKNGQKVFPNDTISLIKRQMGERRELDFHGKKFTPESISALILRQLVETSQSLLESDSRKVVITVPAYFGLTEKNATKAAGEIAGLEVEGIIAEPVAAALSAGFRPGKNQNQTVFVYDLGGGTFDCTVMSLDEDGISVVAVDGDRQLGGADWDQKLFSLVVEKFENNNHLDDDPTLDEEFYQDVLNQSEEAKITLTKKQKAKIRCTYGTVADTVEITREEFENATMDLVDRTLEIAQRTIEKAQEIEPELEVQKYLLVGGSSRMPMISEALSNRYGWELTPTEYDAAVAKGAAIYGQGALDFNLKNPELSDSDQKKFYIGGVSTGEGMTITNVLSKSVGCRFVDETTGKPYIGHLINQNDKLPKSTSITAATMSDNTTSLSFQIYEQIGESPSELLEANKEISPEGGAVMTGLPSLPKNSPIELIMEIDGEGLVTLKGREPKSGQDIEVSARVETLNEEQLLDAKHTVSGLVRSE